MNGLEPGATQGPLIGDKAVLKVEEHIEDATKKGAKVVVGGRRHERGGRFFQPTVLVDVTSSMMVAREEAFGPVAPLFRFKTEEEAIGMANDTEFGLAAYFYGRDIGRVWRQDSVGRRAPVSPRLLRLGKCGPCGPCGDVASRHIYGQEYSHV